MSFKKGCLCDHGFGTFHGSLVGDYVSVGSGFPFSEFISGQQFVRGGAGLLHLSPVCVCSSADLV